MKVVPLPACVPQDREIVLGDDALRVVITVVATPRYYALVNIFSCTNSQYIRLLVALKSLYSNSGTYTQHCANHQAIINAIIEVQFSIEITPRWSMFLKHLRSIAMGILVCLPIPCVYSSLTTALRHTPTPLSSGLAGSTVYSL